MDSELATIRTKLVEEAVAEVKTRGWAGLRGRAWRGAARRDWQNERAIGRETGWKFFLPLVYGAL